MKRCEYWGMNLSEVVSCCCYANKQNYIHIDLGEF